MKKNILKVVSIFSILTLLAACARDLSSSTYTSDSNLSLTLKGRVISARPVTIKNHDKLGDNKTGALAGGAMGAAVGTGVGGGSGKTMAVVGGAIAGAMLGAAAEGKLSTSQGIEYIVELDTSKLKNTYYEGNAAMRNAISTATTSGVITVVQSMDNAIQVGQSVYVIFSDNRTRVILANN